MSIELKIKSKHLSEEARIIRFEEHKQLKQYQWALKKYSETGSNDMFPRWNDKAFMDEFLRDNPECKVNSGGVKEISVGWAPPSK